MALVPLACLVVAGNALMVPVLYSKLDVAATGASDAARSAGVAARDAKNTTRRIDNAAKDNCKRIHRLTHTIDGFLVGSRPRLVQLGREGTLTPSQVRRALADNDDQRAKLRTADCPTPPPRP